MHDMLRENHSGMETVNELLYCHSSRCVRTIVVWKRSPINELLCRHCSLRENHSGMETNKVLDVATEDAIVA